MPAEYVPVFIYMLVAAVFLVVLLFVAKLLRPDAPSAIKQEIYECGIPVSSTARGRYSVRFYLIAILFVVFDVETIFLFPWAVRYKQLGWFGVVEVGVFLAILFVGYIWAYKKGALRWH
ncbi:MAG: NADH-quinone oxidoreductase subunit A [Bryobacterales bacterium]|nr:NADH-quinone oxidoreductase subunit A [Bryobacterales bacterium]